MSKFVIDCPESALKYMEEHCFSETKVEVGGFLIGRLTEGKTIVTRAVKAKKAVGQSTQLTFTHEAWDEIYAELEKHPGEILVGWYHSHPNFGVFLSEHDQFIQNNFFRQDGQITIVIDPVRGRKGWFVSKDNQILNYGAESDTMRKRLGNSATDADANMDVVLGARSGGASNLKIVTISGIMALISFLAGVGFTEVTKSNSSINATALADLQNQIQNLKITFGNNGGVTNTKATPKTVNSNTQSLSTAPKSSKGSTHVNNSNVKNSSTASANSSSVGSSSFANTVNLAGSPCKANSKQVPTLDNKVLVCTKGPDGKFTWQKKSTMPKNPSKTPNSQTSNIETSTTNDSSTTNSK